MRPLREQTISLDLKNVAFEEALDALANVGHTFHRVIGEHVLMVVPDSPAKRREYEPQVVKSFCLSNADLKETNDLLRVVLGARPVAALPGQDALTINDTPDKVAAAERIVEVLDKRRAEVVVDVEILEVNRSRLKEYGIEITSGVVGTTGVAGAIFPNPRGTTTLDDNPYRADNLVMTNLPGVIYRLLQSDATTRLLANPQLRTTEGQNAQATGSSSGCASPSGSSSCSCCPGPRWRCPWRGRSPTTCSWWRRSSSPSRGWPWWRSTRRRLAGPPLLRAAVVFLVLANPWAPQILALLGLFDNWFDFRRWAEPPPEKG